MSELEALQICKGFGIGDIITCRCGLCEYDEKLCCIMDIKQSDGIIMVLPEYYGIFDEDETDLVPFTLSQEIELVCLAQSRLYELGLLDIKVDQKEAFKTNDKIIGLMGFAPPGWLGKVVTISSEKSLLNNILVEFKNFKGGINAIEYFNQTWYPDEYKTESRGRLFVDEKSITKYDNELDLLSNKQAKKVIQAKPQPTFEKHLLNIIKERISQNYPVYQIGVEIYEIITGTSERKSPAFLIDGYPSLKWENFKISQKLAIIIGKILTREIIDIAELKSLLDIKD